MDGLSICPLIDGCCFVGGLGLDLGIIVKAFIDDRDLLVRGLAHPFLFEQVRRFNPLMIGVVVVVVVVSY